MIDWYNIHSNKMSRIQLPLLPGRITAAMVMTVDRQAGLWIGTEADGIYRFDTRTRTLEAFGTKSSDSTHRKITSAWSFYLGSDRTIWAGGWVENGSLHRINARSGEIRSFAQPELSLARSIIEADQNALWVGTWGHGLTRFNPATGEIRNYTERNGLPNNYVKGILRDDRENLWISTERGLSKFNPRTEIFRNYDVNDGLQGNFFYSGSCFKGRDGKLHFGGSRGMNAFYPDSIRDVNYVAPVVLTSFRVLDRQQLFDRSLCLLPQIEISYSDDIFSFEYVALDYRAPERHRYAYTMEGFNDGWIQAGTRRYASYTHLDPGEYIFKVKGTNSDGVWSSNIATVRIRINPAFWQTWWFRAFVVVALLSMLYLLYRYRINKLLELERTRSAIATDLHDDIGTSLTNIALFSDLAQRDVAAGSSEVTHRLEKISQTSRSLLDAMNDIVWSIKPENDALEQTILRMEDYAVEMLEENGIDLHVQIPEQLRKLKLPMTVRRNLFLIFKEVIGNVLKHAAATHVDVLISTTEARKRHQHLRLVISDNGKGFNPSVQERGNGLDNMELRTQHLNGSISIHSAEGQGTKIEIVFPIKSPI